MHSEARRASPSPLSAKEQVAGDYRRAGSGAEQDGQHLLSPGSRCGWRTTIADRLRRWTRRQRYAPPSACRAALPCSTARRRRHEVDRRFDLGGGSGAGVQLQGSARSCRETPVAERARRRWRRPPSARPRRSRRRADLRGCLQRTANNQRARLAARRRPVPLKALRAALTTRVRAGSGRPHQVYGGPRVSLLYRHPERRTAEGGRLQALALEGVADSPGPAAGGLACRVLETISTVERAAGVPARRRYSDGRGFAFGFQAAAARNLLRLWPQAVLVRHRAVLNHMATSTALADHRQQTIEARITTALTAGRPARCCGRRTEWVGRALARRQRRRSPGRGLRGRGWLRPSRLREGRA